MFAKMSSTKSVRLYSHTENIRNRVFGTSTEAKLDESVLDKRSLEEVRVFIANGVLLNPHADSITLDELKKFIHELATKSTPWIVLYARTHDEKIEWYLEPQTIFMEGLFSIFHRPILHVEGKIEVMLRRNSIPYYNTDILKHLHLKELLGSGQKGANVSQLQLIDDSITSQIWGSVDNTCLQISFSINLEWSEDIKIELPSSYGPDAILGNLFSEDSTKDFTFVAEDETEVKCHSQIITAARSAALTALVSPSTGMQESKTRRTVMKSMSKVALTQFVRYLYGLEIVDQELNCQVTLELVQVAHRYELPVLEKAVRHLFLIRDERWFTPNIVLEMYYFARKVPSLTHMKDRMLRMMCRMSPEVLRGCAPYKEQNAEEKENLAWMLFELK